MVKVAPSMLSADFSILLKEIKEIEAMGADYLHIDIMDGHFVPNISFGPMVFKAIRPQVNLKFDCHLLVEEPEKYIDLVVEAGADCISIHYEASSNIFDIIRQIKIHKKMVGIAINPSTSINQIESLLSEIDIVLVMSVNPGYPGQKFLDTVLDKIRVLKELRTENDYHFNIEVDGGINAETGKICVEAGADILVSGSYIFNSEYRGERIEGLKLLQKY